MRRGDGELEFLGKLAERVRHLPRSGVVLGIGDDCAIYWPRGGTEDLLFTTDMLLENVHFLPRQHPPDALGHKALARGLSDIAAMGGEPRFCLLSLALAGWCKPAWVDGFYDGLLALAGTTGTALAGGDLGRAEKFSCDIVVCGSVPRGAALRRDGARPGDCIYVSGPLGGAALGLATHRGDAWKKQLWPVPRLALGRRLRKAGATACMDLSDGLSLDLRRLCLASGVAAEIEPPPVWRGATLEQALHGGEDYELLATAAPSTRMPRGMIAIGRIVSGQPGAVLLESRPSPALGFDHLKI